MLLESNTKKVINLIHQFDNLSDNDKVRLAIYLLEYKKCINAITRKRKRRKINLL